MWHEVTGEEGGQITSLSIPVMFGRYFRLTNVINMIICNAIHRHQFLKSQNFGGSRKLSWGCKVHIRVFMWSAGTIHSQIRENIDFA